MELLLLSTNRVSSLQSDRETNNHATRQADEWKKEKEKETEGENLTHKIVYSSGVVVIIIIMLSYSHSVGVLQNSNQTATHLHSVFMVI